MQNTINEFKFLLSKMNYSFLSQNDIDTRTLYMDL